jgi:hypothetical protein
MSTLIIVIAHQAADSFIETASLSELSRCYPRIVATPFRAGGRLCLETDKGDGS